MSEKTDVSAPTSSSGAPEHQRRLSRRSMLKLAQLPVVAGLVGIARAPRIDVTSATQAGANAVKRSDGSIDLRIKLNNLINAFGPGGGVLYFPPSNRDPDTDYYALTSGPIYLKDNVTIEGLYGYEEQTVLRNVAAASGTFFEKATVRFGGTQFSYYINSATPSQKYRPIQDTTIDQDYIICQKQADADACKIGDQICIVSPQFYINWDEQKYVSMMHNYVVAKSGRRLTLQWPIPFALRSLDSQFPTYAKTGAPIFFRTAEIIGPPPYNGAGQMIVPRNVAIRNMTLASDNGNVMQTQLPLSSELENLIVRAPMRKGLYGNAAQMSLFRNIVCDCGSGIAEIAMCSFYNRFENITHTRPRSCIDDAGTASTLWSWQEGSWGNTLDGLTFAKQQYVWAPSSNVEVFRDTGHDNTILNANVYLNAKGGILFYNVPQSPTVLTAGWVLKNRVVRGMTVTYPTGAGPGTIVNSKDITSHRYEGVRINNDYGTPGLTLSANSHNNVFRDWDIRSCNITVAAGATRNEFTRIAQRAGTFIDNGTRTITAQRTAPPQMWRYGF